MDNTERAADWKVREIFFYLCFLFTDRLNNRNLLVQIFLKMAMDPPIKQGQTRYPFFIFLFNIEEETSVEIKVSE